MYRPTCFEFSGSTNPGRAAMVRPGVVKTEDELEFQEALSDYKRQSGRQFPTWSEILEVLRGLGYAKRIWRGARPIVPPRLDTSGFGVGFQPMGEDSSTGMHCWFSRVETPAGF